MEQSLFPLFPLEVVLLPEELLPLHIFEERYKQMIGECLEAKSHGSGQQEFGVVLAKEREMRPVGGSARIVNLTRKYEDGRMDILSMGTRRFEILYTNAESAYLRAGVDFFEDDPDSDTPPDPEAERAIELFRSAMRQLRRSSEMPIHLPRPYRHLSFRIAAPLPLELEFKQQLLSMRKEADRLSQLTRVIELLIVQLKRLDKARSRAGGNGDVSH